MKTIKFYTLGCKVNQYETQAIREQFACAGYKELENHHPADIYVINTCTVTQRADAESLHFIRRAKKENPRAKIIVTGCLTELDADKIKELKPGIIVVKNRDKGKILSFLPDSPITYHLSPITYPAISGFKAHTRAFLKIQDGCDNACSYCKVPLVRGKSRSRPLPEIIQEAVRLAQNGFKEIVLTGICLGAYGRDLKPRISLVEIIKELEKITGLLRIRLSSIEAGDISNELINLMAESKKLCRHLHIPIQSGDDEILKAMQRRYTRVKYLNLIKKIRLRIPEIAITTDCLVGFPGESEGNFKNTLSLIKEICPLKVHIFPYSRREGTATACLKSAISPAIVRKRAARLNKMAEKCARENKQRFLGKRQDVLFERRLKINPLFWQGYTANYLPVLLKSESNLQNQLLRVRMKKINSEFLIG